LLELWGTCLAGRKAVVRRDVLTDCAAHSRLSCSLGSGHSRVWPATGCTDVPGTTIITIIIIFIIIISQNKKQSQCTYRANTLSAHAELSQKQRRLQGPWWKGLLYFQSTIKRAHRKIRGKRKDKAAKKCNSVVVKNVGRAGSRNFPNRHFKFPTDEVMGDNFLTAQNLRIIAPYLPQYHHAKEKWMEKIR